MDETAHLTWRGGLQVEARIRDLTVTTDKPPEKGGEDHGPMASELYLASLGSCMLTSLLRVAQKRKVPVETLEATVGCDFDRRGMITEVDLELRVTSPAPRDDWATVARLAPKHCTVSDLTAKPLNERLVLNGEDTIPLGGEA